MNMRIIMKTNVSSLTMLMLCSIAMLVASSPAQASFEVTITDVNSGTVVIPLTRPLATFSHNFTTDLTPGSFIVSGSGSSNSPGGSAGAIMDQSGLHLAVSGRADTLIVKLTDTDFNQSGPATFSNTVSLHFPQGAAGSLTALFQAFKDFNNTMYGQTGGGPPALGPFANPGNTSALSGSSSIAITDHPPYSMTLIATITYDGSGTSQISYDYSTNDNSVPGPAAIIVALSGLPCLTGYWLRRRRKEI